MMVLITKMKLNKILQILLLITVIITIYFCVYDIKERYIEREEKIVQERSAKVPPELVQQLGKAKSYNEKAKIRRFILQYYIKEELDIKKYIPIAMDCIKFGFKKMGFQLTTEQEQEIINRMSKQRIYYIYSPEKLKECHDDIVGAAGTHFSLYNEIYIFPGSKKIHIIIHELLHGVVEYGEESRAYRGLEEGIATLFPVIKWGWKDREKLGSDSYFFDVGRTHFLFAPISFMLLKLEGPQIMLDSKKIKQIFPPELFAEIKSLKEDGKNLSSVMQKTCSILLEKLRSMGCPTSKWLKEYKLQVLRVKKGTILALFDTARLKELYPEWYEEE